MITGVFECIQQVGWICGGFLGFVVVFVGVYLNEALLKCVFISHIGINEHLAIFKFLNVYILKKTLVVMKWPLALGSLFRGYHYSVKHTRGNKYLPHSSMWLSGFIFLIWPSTDEQRKLTEERQNGVCPPTQWLFNRGGFFLQWTVSSCREVQTSEKAKEWSKERNLE